MIIHRQYYMQTIFLNELTRHTYELLKMPLGANGKEIQTYSTQHTFNCIVQSQIKFIIITDYNLLMRTMYT